MKEKHKFADKTIWDAVKTQEHCQFPYCATFPADTNIFLHLFESFCGTAWFALLKACLLLRILSHEHFLFLSGWLLLEQYFQWSFFILEKQMCDSFF